jgi:hypothetical protein
MARSKPRLAIVPEQLPRQRVIKELHVSAHPTGCYIVAEATDGTVWMFSWPNKAVGREAAWLRLLSLPPEGVEGQPLE